MKTNPLDPTLKNLDRCGCCAGTEVETPADVLNRPGLSAIAFRSGTHAQFKATLLAALSDKEKSQLGKLRTREDNDLTIALLDGFAAMADVLTFYSERIANESYLRTATERRSVLEQARAIGYELRPGVAAAAWLAFTVEDTPGAPGCANIPKGTKVQSVPGPDEKPQVYETTESMTARKEWNELMVLNRSVATPYFNQKTIRLAGTTTNLKPGDALLIIGDEWEENLGAGNQDFSENWDFRLVKAVELLPDPNPAKTETLVTLNRGLGKKKGDRFIMPARRNARVYALRKRANVFGYNAPDWRSLPTQPINLKANFLNETQDPGNWPGFAIFDGHQRVDLDGVHASVMKGDWVVISDGSYEEVFKVDEVAEWARADFLVTNKTTRLKLLGEWKNLDNHNVRETTVFCEMQELPWAASPVEPPVQGSCVTLDRYVDGLTPGRRLVLLGRHPRLSMRPQHSQKEEALLTLTPDAGAAQARYLKENEELTILTAPTEWKHRNKSVSWRLRDATGTEGSVLATINAFEILPSRIEDESFVEFLLTKRVHSDPSHTQTVLEFTESLNNVYDPSSVRIFANVAPATHGETVEEIVGSGNSSQAHQQFSLKQKPLTFAPSETPTGESSLEVFVNDVKWTEADSLYGRGPRERVFVTRRQDDGTIRLTFGNGRAGALLPTGIENIRTRYRKGIGLEGAVKAGQLTLLMKRPLGVKSVLNPAASSVGQDPEQLEDARRNAPLQTLTLGRAVSLQDYEDFARSFGGIAKAHAAWVWTPQGRGVFVTVALPGGVAPTLSDNATRDNLKKALKDFGNPLIPLDVQWGEIKLFDIAGRVLPQPDRIAERVKADVNAELRKAFSFDVRRFGQNVGLSEIMAIVQDIPGVLSVTLSDPAKMIEATCPAAGSAIEKTQPAQVLVLNEKTLSALEVSTE